MKNVFYLLVGVLLFAQCQRDNSDSIENGDDKREPSEIIANNQNGVTLSKKEYLEFEKQAEKERKEWEIGFRKMQEEQKEFQEYVENGGRVDFENIPPPPMTHKDSVACQEQRRKAAIMNADPEIQQEWRLHRQKFRLYEEIKYPKKKRESQSSRGFYGVLESVYKNYNGSCIAGDYQSNNCAHYLSDSFMRSSD